jgi:peptidoglycan hydrolase-like protein with peptidoglycan-binding domain
MAMFLRKGSSGPEVRDVQEVLNFLIRPAPRLYVDGVFGPPTQACVVAFQKQSRLDADGVVDPRTMRALADATLSALCTLSDPGVGA